MRRLALLAAVALPLVGCGGLSDKEQRTVTGGAAGASAGALIGALAGAPEIGALVGGGVGLAGGYLLGLSRESERDAYQAGYAEGRQTLHIKDWHKPRPARAALTSIH